MDADTGQIAATALTTSDVDDASQVGPLLDKVDRPVASFTADGAYDQDGDYGEVAARHSGPPSSSHHGPAPCRTECSNLDVRSTSASRNNRPS
jgi:hypothetical protein